MARIAAVADVYDAITSERLYAPARPACDGVRAIIEGAGTLFDPEVVDAFRRVVAPFPPAREVELTDGRTGDRGQRSRRRARPPGGPRGRTRRRLTEISLLHDTSVGIEGWDHQSYATPLAA